MGRLVLAFAGCTYHIVGKLVLGLIYYSNIFLSTIGVSNSFFEVGIPNLVCGCILGWGSVAYHFRVIVTLALTSDLVFRIIVSGAYFLYSLR